MCLATALATRLLLAASLVSKIKNSLTSSEVSLTAEPQLQYYAKAE